MKRAGVWIAGAILVLTPGNAALAYRPFDGTDAAVAEPGVLEIELGPARYVEVGPERTLIAPDVIVNLGLADRWELVLQGGVAHGLQPDAPGASLLGNGVFLKGVMREGVLQGKLGPSIATEFGFLLPDINNGDSGTGGTAALIVSQRWDALTVHVNAGAAVTRQQHADMAFSMIVEGPHDWPVRPVAELFYERDFGGSETSSALVGAIWQVRENVALDLGLRSGWVDGQSLREIRLGMTFGFGVLGSRR